MRYVDLKNTTTEDFAARASRKPKKQLPKGFLVVGTFMAILLVLGVVFNQKIKAFFNPISIVGNVTAANLKQTDGRTNVLIIGLDKRDSGPVTSVLTDTLIVASIGNLDKDIVLISLPRDLWVQNPNGGYSKINEVYAYAKRDPQATQKVAENVLGIPIHYYVVVDFDIFKETINTLGGIDVNVESAFTDNEYPAEGKENDSCGLNSQQQEEANKKITEEGMSPLNFYSCRYEKLNFPAGMQHMDGETALKYARSRHSLGTEGTDFARAKRQQQVILAVKDKALSVKTLLNPVKIKDLFDTYSRNVQTNIDLNTAQGFASLSQQVNFSNIKSIVLDDRSSAEVGGLLYAPTDRSLYGGAYVLIPRVADFSQLHAYVQKYIFEVK